MSEELKIEVDVKANDDSAKKTLDALIKEYNNKSLDFQVKLDKFDISGINNSITKLTSDLNKLSNIEFDSLNKLETNLKNINKLATAYRQVDNEITRLIKSRDKLEVSGDYKTVQVLDKQISSWKEMQQGIENATKSAKVYDQVIEKVQNSISKNKNSIDINKSQLEVKLDVNHENAVKKVNEFKTKMLSNLQELERKYKGTQMFDQVVNEIEKFKSELKGLDDYLENVSNVDMKHLSGEFRRLNQELIQTKRDLNDIGKSIKSDFFGDLYDSLRTFTLGNLIGDAIQDGISSIKNVVVELDNATRDLMKVAPAGFEGTSEQLKTIKYDAIDVAKVVGQSSEDVIQGMAKALQTGAKTMSDALEIAKSSATFANVGDLSQDQADTYIASIMSAYGGMSNALKPVREQVQGMSNDYNNLTKFLDLANYAGNNFSISTGDVGEALMRSGAILSEYGVSMQDAISMIVGANESVQDADKVGNSIKSMAVNLGGIKAAAKDGSVETTKAAKALSTLAGIDIYSNRQKGEVKDMMTILKELNLVWDDLSEDKKLAIGESIAGKEHINTLMAMMGNWETVLQYQEDYASGFTIGSAQREQERYLDSIEGKWNVLKENLKGLVSTVITSDFAKSILDVAISVTDSMSKIFKTLDDMNAVLPVTIGLITALVQSFGALSGDGTVEIFGSGMINGIKSLNEALKGTTIQYSTTNKGIQKLSNNQTKLSKSTTKTSDSFKKYSLSVGDASQSIIRVNRENTTLAKSQVKVSGGMSSVISSFSKSAVASKLAMVGTSLLNGALIGLASAGIGMAIKAFDNHINKYKIAAEKSKENINNLNDEIQAYQSQKKSLSEIAKEYDELAKKTNKSASEVERFSQLKNQIAEIMPELVVGYDENNDPILKMNGSAEDLIKSLDIAIEKKNNLIQNNKIEQGKNTLKDLNKDSYQDSNGLYRNEDSNAWVNYVNKIDTARKSVEKSINKLGKTSGDDFKNQLEKAKNNWENYCNVIAEGASKVDSEYSNLQSRMSEVYQGINEQFNKRGTFKGFEDDIKQFAYNLTSSLDFSGLSDANVTTFVRNVEKALSDGNIDVSLQKYLDARTELEKTGQYEKYEQTIKKITPELAKTLGMNEQLVSSMIKTPSVFKQAQSELDAFLMTFGKREQMMSFDVETQQLAQKFEAFASTFEELSNSANMMTIDGKFQLDPEIEFSKDLPSEIQELINKFKSSDGYMSKEEVEILAELMFSYQTGEGKDARQGLQDEIDKLLGKDTVKVDNIDVLAEVKIDTKLEDALNSFRSDKSTKLLVEVVGTEKAQLYSDIISKLQTTPELTNKFILDNQEALANVKSYEEVVKWLQNNPEIVSKYKITGIEKLDEVDKKKKEIEKDGKSTTTVQVKETGVEETKKDLEEVSKKQNEIDSKDVNLSVNKGELQGSVEDFNKLIEYSTKLKDGEYQISFKSDTTDAINQIDNLKLAVNNLSNQFMQMPSTTVTIHTALAAQNISGLLVRIGQVKTAIDGIKGKTIQIATAQSAKNLSGLITRVNQYRDAINNTPDKTTNIHTSQSAKNLSGLIRKIESYNETTISQKTVKVNVSNAISQVQTLLNKINALPRTKTVTVKVSQSGSATPKIVPRSVFSTNGQENTGENPVSANISPLSEVSTHGDTDTVVSGNPTASPMLRRISSTDAKNMFDYDVDIFKKLENSLKKISNELDIISKKSENAFGQEKINYLQRQIELLKQQQQLQHSLAEDMRVQQDVLKNYLLGKGFTFDAENNIANYSQKLLAYEKHVKSLENKANANKDNDKLQAQYDGAKKDLDEIKNALNSYLDLTFSKIPDASKEWWDLQNSISDAREEIEKINREQKLFITNNKLSELENEYKSISNTLDFIDKKSEAFYGSEKISFLREQVNLLEQQKTKLHEIANTYREQINIYKGELVNFGFAFDDLGNVKNIDEVLNNLVNSSDFEKAKDILEEYLDIQNDKLPQASRDWWDLENAIKDTLDSIEKLNREQKLFATNNKLIELTDHYNGISNAIDMLEAKEENFYGKDRLDIINQKVDLLEQQKNKLHEIANAYREQLGIYREDLSKYGFTFDDSGNISDIDEVLNKHKNSVEFEKIKELVEEYLDIQKNKIPDASKEWWDLENAIKDAYKEQLNITKEIEDKITEIYKKQIKDRIEAMNSETDKRVENLKKQKDAYNKYREEANYKDEYEEKLANINDIQKQLDIAMRDTSLQGQKKVQELQKLLADAQKELDKFTQDKIDSDINDAFDKEINNIEETNKNAIEALEKEWSESKIAEMVSQAISSGIFEGIDGKVSGLQDAMLEFAQETGELFGVMGTVIKSELISNLDIAMDTFRDLGNIIKNLDLEKFSTLSKGFNVNMRSMPSVANLSPSLVLNAPMIHIEGNADKDVIEDLKSFGDKIVNDVINKISSSIR